MADLEVLLYAPDDSLYRSSIEIAVDTDEYEFLKYFLGKMNALGVEREEGFPIKAIVFDEDGHRVDLREETHL